MNLIDDERRSEMEDGINVIRELDDSLAMILLGLEALVPRERRPRSLDAAMQNLAPGFERFMKLTYILAEQHLGGVRPDQKTMKRVIGHDLIVLLDAVAQTVGRAPDYAARPAVADDLNFIRDDDGMRDLVAVLGHFGQKGRYSRLDDLVSDERKGADGEPSRRWEEIEQEFVWARPDADSIAESMELMTPATFEVSRCLQRLARAIARMWTLGALGDGGQMHYGVLSIFAALDDEDLGKDLGTG
jgi:hypothetical protein